MNNSRIIVGIVRIKMGWKYYRGLSFVFFFCGGGGEGGSTVLKTKLVFI